MKKGYIVRVHDRADKRILRLRLSAKSRTRLSRASAARKHLLLALFETLSDAEFKQYVALNRKIINALNTYENQ
jgi:DNA-binding MarR family transcriptional regulator